MNSADQKAEQENAGDGQRRDIDRPVLPQFTSYRPVHWPARRQDRGRDSLRVEGFRHGVRLSIHLAAPCFTPASLPGLSPLLSYNMATNKSAMWCLRPSPRTGGST